MVIGPGDLPRMASRREPRETRSSERGAVDQILSLRLSSYASARGALVPLFLF